MADSDDAQSDDTLVFASTTTEEGHQKIIEHNSKRPHPALMTPVEHDEKQRKAQRVKRLTRGLICYQHFGLRRKSGGIVGSWRNKTTKGHKNYR